MVSILKKAFRKLRAVLSPLPLLLLILLLGFVAVQFFAPMLTYRSYAPFADEAVRRGTAFALLIGALGVALWMLAAFLRRRRRDAAEEGAREPTPEEVALANLDRNFTLATGLVRERWQGTGNHLYGMPWYLLLGFSGAGKTSLVDNAGLRFPIEHPMNAAMKTLAGRGSDAVTWRVANEAVILDIDGNLLNGDDPVNAALWSRLLKRILGHRGRLPLNGIVLVIDFAEFAGMNADERATLAGTIRDKMQEVVDRLGIQPTVYLTFTKIDLIAGFLEFFENLTPTERETLFGLHFEQAATAQGEWFAEFEKEYAKLVARLHEKSLLRMRDLRDTRSKREAYLFARQMAGLFTGLRAFLEDALGPDRYSSPPLMRGIYFTSVRQENVPGNVFMDAVARRYLVSEPAYPAHGGVSKPFFSTGLLTRAVFPEAGIAAPNRRVETRRRRTVLSTAAAWAVLCLGGGLYWYVQHDRNLARAAVVLDRSEAFVAAHGALEAPDAVALLEPLNAIREATDAFLDYDSVSELGAALRLYQGKTVGPIADGAYLTTLHETFGPALGRTVEARMRVACPGSEAELDLLSIYLMLASPENRNDAAIDGYFVKRWQEQLTGDAVRQRQLREHLDYLLDRSRRAMEKGEAEKVFALDADAALIRAARANMRNLPAYERLYRGLETAAARLMPNPVDLSAAVGPSFDVVYVAEARAARAPLRPGGADADDSCIEDSPSAARDDPMEIERFFTRRQYKEYFVERSRDLSLRANEDLWVLGELSSTEYSPADIDRTRDELRKLYGAEYVATWREALNSLRIVPFDTLARAVEVLDALSGSNRPMQRLVDAVADQTILYGPLPEGAEPPQGEMAEYRETGFAIQRAFASIHRLREENGSDAEPNLEEIRAALFAVLEYVRNISDSSAESKAALRAAVKRTELGDDPLYVLQRIASGAPPPFDQHLRDIVDRTWRAIMRQALTELESEWQEKVYGAFWLELNDAYPFDPDSPTDAPVEDFKAFFRPDGVLDTFLRKDLGPFINEDTGELRVIEGLTLDVDPAFVQNIRDGRAITRSFFAPGGTLAIEYEVTPMIMSGALAGSSMNVEGQIVQYTGGPTRPSTIVWPNAVQAVGASRLTLAPRARGQGLDVFARTGPWSWLRLYDAGEKANFTNNTVEVTYADRQNRRMTYRYRARSSVNPFFNSPLRGFSLPQRLSRKKETETDG